MNVRNISPSKNAGFSLEFEELPMNPDLPPPGSDEPVGRKKIGLAGVDLCCDLLDLGLDDLDPAGGVDGLDCLEEIAGDLARDDPVEERG